MKIDFQTFKNMPDSTLRTLSGETENGQQGEPSQSAQSSQTGSGDNDNVFNLGDFTENKQSNTQGAQGANTAQGAQGAPNSGNNTNVPPKSNRKSLSELTGNKGGKFATDLMDFLIGALVYMIVRKIGYKVDKSTFRLNKDEKEACYSSWQRVLDETFIDINNPWVQLAIVLGVIYGSKIMYEIPDLKKAVSDAVFNAGEKKAESKKDEPPIVEYVEPVKSWQEVYEEEYIELVNEQKAARKKGADEAKAYIKKSGMDKRLMNKVKKKLGVID